MSPQLTILTPTWNRRHLLPRLYDSLVAQQAPRGSFEWLVVDDGSTDGTFDWLETLIPRAPFPIRAIRQENGGKCRALNFGVEFSRGDWLLVLDSDDKILPEALVKILNCISIYRKSDVAVIFGLMQFTGRSNQHNFKREFTGRFEDWANSGCLFDTAQIFRTDVLRKFPFPVANKETFMAESWIFHKIDRHFLSRFTNIFMIEAEYQKDGLSAKSLILRAQSPISAMRVYSAQLDSKFKVSLKIRAAINFWRYYFHSRRAGKGASENVSSKWYFAYIPFGFLLFLWDFTEVAKRHTPR